MFARQLLVNQSETIARLTEYTKLMVLVGQANDCSIAQVRLIHLLLVNGEPNLLDHSGIIWGCFFCS